MGYRLRRRRAATAVLTTALVGAALLTSAELVAAQAAAPIPSTPGPLTVPRFIGSPVTPDPISSFTVPQNPNLAPNPDSNIHNDAYGTNAYPGLGPDGVSPVVT